MGPTLMNWPVLLGQAAEMATDAGAVAGDLGPMNGVPIVVILLPIAVVALVVLVPVVMGIRAEQHKREMEHAERMRAIELGRPIPGDAGWWSPARTAVGIGVGVPLGVFGIAFVASLLTEQAAPFIWPSAGGIGLAAVICGTVLASRLPDPSRSPAPPPGTKPYTDPDAYDAAEHQHA